MWNTGWMLYASRWMNQRQNSSTLAVNKCWKMQHQHNKHQWRRHKQIQQSKILGEGIDRSNKVKYLGGFLDSTLSFCQHVLAKCQAANINLQKIRDIRKFLTKDTCQQLVQSMVMSHLDYANTMLSGLPKSLIKIMQCTQNRAARITAGKAKIKKWQCDWNKKITALAPS